MRSVALLIVGALIGIVLAASGLLENKNNLLNASSAVAEVNGISISQAQYSSITAAVASEKKTPLIAEDHDFFLQKLIDEELLVQRGQELGLLQLNSVIRNDIVQAVMASIIAENAMQEVSDSDLEGFYKKHRAFFSPATKIHLRQMKFTERSVAESARLALVNGEGFLEVNLKLADKALLSIPDTLLPLNSLRKYIGPSMLMLVSKLEVAQYSQPILHQEKWYVFFVVEKELATAPPLSEITDVVRSEHKRRSDEQAFRDYVEWLRKRADVQRMPTAELQSLIAR